MKKFITHFVLLSAMLTVVPSAAQIGTWYFGHNGGFAFTSTGTTTAPGSSINTHEGCAGVVNSAGDVVMYTDGTTIWNGSHTVQAVPLGGDASSTQAVLIVPIPGSDCNSFFIFTTGAIGTDYDGPNAAGVSCSGWRVSLATVAGTAPTTTITITGSNTNQNLLSGSHTSDLMSERLSATSDGAGGYWVITHGVGTYGTYTAGTNSFSSGVNTGGEGNFYRVHVTATTTTIAALAGTLGIVNFTNNPHRSASHPTSGGGLANYNGQGQMKFNSAGTRIGVALTYQREVQLYDFNPATGAITNQVILTGAFHLTNDPITYGLEFSPNGTYLYISTTYNGAVNTPRVYQFDLSSGVVATVVASKNQVSPSGVTGNYYYTQLQLGPDNRIYVARYGQTSIDVITMPNSASCGYSAAGQAISGTCDFGLPTVLKNNSCEGNSSSGCNCMASTSVVSAGNITQNGTGSIQLQLNSGGTSIKRLKITLVNFNQNIATECMKCDMTNAEQFGTIVNTPTILSTGGVLTPFNTSSSVSFSKEIVWTFVTPQVIPNTNVTLNLQFPPVLTLSCCENSAEYCLKIEYIDEHCVVCENTTCVSTTGGDSGGRLQAPEKEPLKPFLSPDMQKEPLPVTPNGQSLKLFPNPTDNSVTVELPGDNDGTIEVFNNQGVLVLEQRMSGKSMVLNTQSLTNGIYTVRCGALQQTLVISK